ncbi:MAG: FecR family protein [Spirochaetales bacterium]|nr:FecR family protein [Spirochaetales bacterium]
MKKILTAALLLVWGAGLVFSQEAQIRELYGTVEVKQPDASAWTPASSGQALKPGTHISTGFKSGAVIMINGSALTVRALTRLSLEELVQSAGSGKAEINLRAGRVRADVNPPPAGGSVSFVVRSPSATASVRGTVFEFDGLRLRVDEGRVHIAGSDGSGTNVGAGQTAHISAETGRAAGAGESAREELTPPMPAGMDSPHAPAAAAAASEMKTGFTWN